MKTFPENGGETKRFVVIDEKSEMHPEVLEALKVIIRETERCFISTPKDSENWVKGLDDSRTP